MKRDRKSDAKERQKKRHKGETEKNNTKETQKA